MQVLFLSHNAGLRVFLQTICFVIPPGSVFGEWNHCWYLGMYPAHPYICTLSVDKGGTNKATGRAVESWDSVLLGRSHWTVTRAYADLLALCSAASHSSLISGGLCGRGRGLTETGRGPSIAVYLWLDQDPSYCRETRRWSRDWKSHVPFPLPPTTGPFATDGSWLIYMAESCDGAPSLPSFVLPSSPSPPPALLTTLQQLERQQFLPEQKIGRGCETVALFPF